MTVELPELVSCEIHRYGLVEPGLTELFLSEAGPGRVVFDIGAHLGYYSLLGAALGAEVHAFEPARRTFHLLERNVGTRAFLLHKGLWHSTTELELKDFGPRHSAVNTFVESRDEDLGEPRETYTVPVTTVDGYVDDTGAVPHLIKIDSEGAELEILRGTARTIAEHRPLLTIEVGDVTPGESRTAIEHALGFGYAPYDLTPSGPRPHALRDTYSYDNVLMAPRGRVS